jgi:hypothetical protein
MPCCLATCMYRVYVMMHHKIIVIVSKWLTYATFWLFASLPL